MSQLGEYCDRLLRAENKPLYQFCALHNLERTGIRRLLKGERLPKEDLFEAFVKALTLTPEEDQKIHELYRREKIGAEHYENRLFVKTLLEYIAALQAYARSALLSCGTAESVAGEPNPGNQLLSADVAEPESGAYSAGSLPLPSGAAEQKETSQPLSGGGLPASVLHNSLAISDTVRSLMQAEKGEIFTNLSVECPEPLQTILQELISQGKNETVFYHLLTAVKKSELFLDFNYNLKILKTILPFLMQSGMNYQPFYCYGHPAGRVGLGLYPYFMLTSDRLLLLSSDLTVGILYTDQAVLEGYRLEVQKLLRKMKPFFFQSTQSEQTVSFYMNNNVTSGQALYTLEYYPCVLQAYSRELFYANITEEAKQNAQLTAMVEQLAQIPKKWKPYDAFLSLKGLRFFVETGQLGGRYGQLLKPFDRKARCEVLRRLEERCRTGAYRLHLLPEHYLDPFPQIALELYSGRCGSLSSADSPAVFVNFEESTIVSAFEDYCKSLLEDPEVSTVKETEEVLKQLRLSLM